MQDNRLISRARPIASIKSLPQKVNVHMFHGLEFGIAEDGLWGGCHHSSYDRCQCNLMGNFNKIILEQLNIYMEKNDLSLSPTIGKN